MAIVSFENLGKYYGAQDVFSDISAQIERGDHIGLVGPNGHGKTTLLRILAGVEEPSAGIVTVARGLSIGYLPQDGELHAATTLHRAMLEAFEPLLKQQEILQDLERQMTGPDCPAEVFDRYGDLQARFELAGGYTFEAQIRRVLAGLGFDNEDYSQPLAHLSGGQRTRAKLARLLLEAPDLLLLDEPINHLDLEGIEWLEGFLKEWKGSFVVVAHDRRFLDAVTNRVWEMSHGRLETYPGNYSHYIHLRGERIQRRHLEYQAQQDQIARVQAFIQRYKAGQRAREAKGRWRRLQRLERLERPQETRLMHLPLQTDVRSGDLVLRSHGLVAGYVGPPRREVLRCPDLVVLRGERVAILGPNGAGKTTLVRTLVGELLPLAGEVQLGANVRLGYLAQAHAGLRPEHTALEEILEVRNLPLSKARDFLGRFLFSGDDIYKRIEYLSGGERSRVALARLTLQGANVLFLDEPTNHLDIDSQVILENVLSIFRGTILMVSHDRQFVDNLATQLWVIRDGQLEVFRGSYSEYQEVLRNASCNGNSRIERNTALDPRREQKQEERRRQREERQRQDRIRYLEREAMCLQQELRALEERLGDASSRSEVEEVSRLGNLHRDVQARLDAILEEWAGLA